MRDKEIVNTDGSRNWQANILLDNLKRLEQENTELKAENARLKERIIKLSEENGNLIIRANTCSNNYRDTQRRLDELCKANIHNLTLLSKANKTLQEIKAIAKTGMHCEGMGCDFMPKILDLITKAESEG